MGLNQGISSTSCPHDKIALRTLHDSDDNIFSGAHLTVYCLFDTQVDSVSWQQVYQLSLTTGGVFGPSVAEPFLLEIPQDLENSTMNGGMNETVWSPLPEDVTIMYAFLITGCLTVLFAVISFLVYFVFGGITVKTRAKMIKGSAGQVLPGRLKVLYHSIIVLLVFYYVFQSVFSRTYSNYIVPFTVSELGWTKAQGANLATAYSAASTVGKVVIIFMIRCLLMEVILNLGLVLCSISALALSFLLHYHVSVVWIFTCLLSLGTSFTVSLLMAWTDKYVGLKGFVGVIYSVAASLGEIAFNPVIGYLLESVSYISYMYLVLSSTVTCLVIMIVLQILARMYHKATEYESPENEGSKDH